jgi:uncharacterized protein (TIGR01244 family)
LKQATCPRWPPTAFAASSTIAPTTKSQAQQAGLGWRHIPVISGQFAEAEVDRFAEALSELPGPVLAFCRSGTRCSALWALQAEGSVDDVLSITRAAGYDLSMLRSLLARNHGG